MRFGDGRELRDGRRDNHSQKASFRPNCIVRGRWASMGWRKEFPARQLGSPAELFNPP
jgi:hypothetical protein